MKSPPPGWIEGTRELRFTLGEKTLFTKRVRAWSARPHAVADLVKIPAFSEVPDGVRVLAIQSLPVDADLPRVTRLPGVLRYAPAHFNHHWIELAGTFEEYLALLSAKSRHEMARKVRRFEAHAAGRHELREYRAPSEMAEFVRLASALSRMTYQGRLLAAGMPEGAPFVEELEAAAARDEVRGFVLFVAGQTAAYGYCRASGDVLVFEHTGYDPALATHSPGIFLLREMLVRTWSEGRFRLFDFGSGDAQYKRSYATVTRRCATVLQFRRRPRDTALVAAHRGLTAFSDGCARLLESLGLKRRLKRFFRRRSGAPPAGSDDQDKTPEFGT